MRRSILLAIALAAMTLAGSPVRGATIERIHGTAAGETYSEEDTYWTVAITADATGATNVPVVTSRFNVPNSYGTVHVHLERFRISQWTRQPIPMDEQLDVGIAVKRLDVVDSWDLGTRKFRWDGVGDDGYRYYLEVRDLAPGESVWRDWPAWPTFEVVRAINPTFVGVPGLEGNPFEGRLTSNDVVADDIV